ncbi:hypothetical protein J6Z19_06020 [bacterium]|nr:hypothetical protein [bacterium]
MKRLFFLPLVFALAFMSVACDSGNTGDFRITLKLPIDYDENCGDYGEEDHDYTYCINADDQIQLSIYSKSDPKETYLYTDSTLIDVNKVGNNNGGKTEFIRSLKKGTYYRFFVEVTNSNEKLKLTGGIEGVYYDDSKNYEVDIFLAPAGDFARVVGERSNYNADYKSLTSYFQETSGSKGATAVALKDARIFMAGGFDFEEDEISNKAAIFDMKALSKKEMHLPSQIYDHVAALVDDGSETGKVVIGLGTTDGGLNDTLWIYDPDTNKYNTLSIGAPAMTKAKAITIDGSVYIIGGCTDSGASNAVYKIYADESGRILTENFATLKTGRCNHAVADFSTVDENGNKNVRILVVGGSTDYKTEGKETPVLGGDFAELVTQGASKALEIVDRNGKDDAELKTTGLISPAAVGMLMDDKEESEMIATVLGGYIRNVANDEEEWIANPRLFVFSEDGDKLVYDSNSTPNECARPSAALLGSEEKNALKYVAVNCGTKEMGRTGSDYSDQIIFVLQVKRVKNSDLGREVFSSSVKDTLMEGNKDKDSSAKIVDGPVAVDGLGQVFMFGGFYVYQVGSYAIP